MKEKIGDEKGMKEKRIRKEKKYSIAVHHICYMAKEFVVDGEICVIPSIENPIIGVFLQWGWIFERTQ